MIDVRRWRFGALAFAGGVIVALDAPPTNLISGLWIGMTLLAIALAMPVEKRPRLTLLWRGELFGIGANAVIFRFVPSVITHFTPLPFVVGGLALLLLA